MYEKRGLDIKPRSIGMFGKLTRLLRLLYLSLDPWLLLCTLIAVAFGPRSRSVPW
jgi:hypothetical protein